MVVGAFYIGQREIKIVFRSGVTGLFRLQFSVQPDLNLVGIDGISAGFGSSSNPKCQITNVQGDLNIKLSWVANTDYVEVAVYPYVEMDNQTVFLVAACAKNGSGTQLRLDTYDGFTMYETQLYKDKAFNNPSSAASAFLWLTIVPKDESFGVEDALKHLTYVGAYYSSSTKPEVLKDNKDSCLLILHCNSQARTILVDICRNYDIIIRKK